MMFSPPTENQTQSLAGMLQSCALVYQLARTDRFDETAMHSCAISLLRIDGESVEHVYGGAAGIDLGMRTMVHLFSGKPDQQAMEIYQYAAAVHRLGLKLMNLQNTAEVIHRELIALDAQYHNNQRRGNEDSQDSQDSQEWIYSELADLYSKTISFISPRIIVQGSPGNLQQPQSVNRVRVALFAGIRAAFMWHQFGGRRRHLLFGRNYYAAAARSYLNRNNKE